MAKIIVKDCFAGFNGGDGLHIRGDSADVEIDGFRAISNAGSGIYVHSEQDKQLFFSFMEKAGLENLSPAQIDAIAAIISEVRRDPNIEKEADSLKPLWSKMGGALTAAGGASAVITLIQSLI